MSRCWQYLIPLEGKTTFSFLINVIIEKICRAEEHQQVAFYELVQSQGLYRNALILSSKIKLYNPLNHCAKGDIRYLRALQQLTGLL